VEPVQVIEGLRSPAPPQATAADTADSYDRDVPPEGRRAGSPPPQHDIPAQGRKHAHRD